MQTFRTLADAIHDRRKSEKGIRFIYGAAHEEFMTYGGVYDRAAGVLGLLQSRGIGKGDEILFQIENNRDFIIMFWACVLGGIVPVPVTCGNNEDYRLKVMKIWKILVSPSLACSAETMDILADYAGKNGEKGIAEEIRRKTILTESMDKNTEFKALPVESKGDDTAFIQFSSGSTGDPKGVVLTHNNLLANIEMIRKGSGAGTNDSYLCWMPLTHDLGLIGCHLNPLVNNISQYNMQTSLFIRRPELWMQKTHEHRVTMLQSPNFGFNYFLENLKQHVKKDWDLSCVRIMYNGAEPISAVLCDKFLSVMKAYGMKDSVMYPVYGLAEASVAVSFPVPGEKYRRYDLDRNFLLEGQAVKACENQDNCVTFVEVGYPLDGCKVRIFNGKSGAPDGVIGRIQITGDNVTKGYYRNEEATKKAFTDDGWLDTGDLGFTDSGRLVITGRAKDIIFINGQNFYPHDIERLAERAEGVDMGGSAACGVFNKNSQNEELAVFVLSKKEPEQIAGIVRGIKSLIVRHTGIHPAAVIPVKKFPKTTSGKLQRYKLKKDYEHGVFEGVLSKMRELAEMDVQDAGGAQQCGRLEQEISGIVCSVVGAASVGIDDNFFDIGAGSLQLAMIVEQIGKKYPGRVSVTDMFRHTTIRKLAGFIQAEKATGLPGLLLPVDFYREIKSRKEMVNMGFRINPGLYENLGALAREERVGICDVMLAVFIYMVSKIAVNKDAEIFVMNDSSDMIIRLPVLAENALDFSDLLRVAVHGRMKKTGMYSIEELSRAGMNKSDNAVSLFFGPLPEQYGRIKDFFDFILEAPDDDSGGAFSLRFNGNRFRKDRIMKFIDDFVHMLSVAADKYRMQTSGKGS